MTTLLHTTPESVGISSKVLLEVMKELCKLHYLNSISILRHGRCCLEGWVAPYCRETPHQLFSLSKSFTSCGIGLAQAEGRLSVQDKLVSFFPEYGDCIVDSRMNKVTLADLLTMRSGHLACTTRFMFGTDDYVKAFLSSPLDTEPGTRFTYNSGASYMLAAVIKKVTGENLREYLGPRLFEPLQMTPGIWECCPKGINLGGWGLYMTTDDIAKFAQLLLQHGKWEGRQILPEDYLAEATRKHADNSMNEAPDWKQGYGYQFWRSRHGYRGDGASGQYAIVLEEQDIAIAVTSCVDNMQAELDVLWKKLLPYVNDAPLPEAPEEHRELLDYLQKMAIPTPEPSGSTWHAPATFRFQDNPAGIRQCDIFFSEKDCALTFQTNRGSEQLRAGFGHFDYSTFQLTDALPHPVAAYAIWKNPHTLEIHSFICDGIFRDIWTVDFEDTKVPLKNQMVCSCFRPGKPQFIVKSLQ